MQNRTSNSQRPTPNIQGRSSAHLPALLRKALQAGWTLAVGRLKQCPLQKFDSFVQFLSRWNRLVQDLVYPRNCMTCGRETSSDLGYLCWDCLANTILVQPPFCSLCGDPVSGKVGHEYICHFCTTTTRHFDSARSAARYDGVTRDVLQSFKYRKALWMNADLVSLLEGCVSSQFDVDTIDGIVPVPLFPTRKREREFNQAESLAKALAGRFRKPYVRRALRRIRPTPSQTNLTAEQRAANVSGAFRARASTRLAGGRMLLVDDVMTTGATVNECARILKKQAGVGSVLVATVARG